MEQQVNLNYLQEAAIKSIEEFINYKCNQIGQKHNVILNVNLPTGTGKSLIKSKLATQHTLANPQTKVYIATSYASTVQQLQSTISQFNNNKQIKVGTYLGKYSTCVFESVKSKQFKGFYENCKQARRKNQCLCYNTTQVWNHKFNQVATYQLQDLEDLGYNLQFQQLDKHTFQPVQPIVLPCLYYRSLYTFKQKSILLFTHARIFQVLDTQFLQDLLNELLECKHKQITAKNDLEQHILNSEELFPNQTARKILLFDELHCIDTLFQAAKFQGQWCTENSQFLIITSIIEQLIQNQVLFQIITENKVSETFFSVFWQTIYLVLVVSADLVRRAYELTNCQPVDNIVQQNLIAIGQLQEYLFNFMQKQNLTENCKLFQIQLQRLKDNWQEEEEELLIFAENSTDYQVKITLYNSLKLLYQKLLSSNKPNYLQTNEPEDQELEQLEFPKPKNWQQSIMALAYSLQLDVTYQDTVNVLKFVNLLARIRVQCNHHSKYIFQDIQQKTNWFKFFYSKFSIIIGFSATMNDEDTVNCYGLQIQNLYQHAQHHLPSKIPTVFISQSDAYLTNATQIQINQLKQMVANQKLQISSLELCLPLNLISLFQTAMAQSKNCMSITAQVSQQVIQTKIQQAVSQLNIVVQQNNRLQQLSFDLANIWKNQFKCQLPEHSFNLSTTNNNKSMLLKYAKVIYFFYQLITSQNIDTSQGVIFYCSSNQQAKEIIECMKQEFHIEYTHQLIDNKPYQYLLDSTSKGQLIIKQLTRLDPQIKGILLISYLGSRFSQSWDPPDYFRNSFIIGNKIPGDFIIQKNKYQSNPRIQSRPADLNYLQPKNFYQVTNQSINNLDVKPNTTVSDLIYKQAAKVPYQYNCEKYNQTDPWDNYQQQLNSQIIQIIGRMFRKNPFNNVLILQKQQFYYKNENNQYVNHQLNTQKQQFLTLSNSIILTDSYYPKWISLQTDQQLIQMLLQMFYRSQASAEFMQHCHNKNQIQVQSKQINYCQSLTEEKYMIHFTQSIVQ